MPPDLSYAQRFEDLYLLRCFGAQEQGFYIDIGAGHPVVDNVSFAFYQRGWRGITVEPNPYLAGLNRAVRPRDAVHHALAGAKAGRAAFFQVEEFHGFSTMIADHAETARTQFGKGSSTLDLPVTTLKELCEQSRPAAIDFLKVDVEGAEKDVLLGGDWKNFRPKIVLVEALAPFTMEPSWQDWEPMLTAQGYRFVFFDTLNRYYVAAEHEALARSFETAPASFDAVQFGVLQPALAEERHPDRGAAALLARAAMTRLPLLDRDLLVDLLTAELPPAALERPADQAAVVVAWERVFGRPPVATDLAPLALRADMTLREVYALIAASDVFRIVCGRISASYAW